MTIEAPGREIIAVQMLRAVAATMVVFVHINNQLARLHYNQLRTEWMGTGVDIFFVISGFIMWTSVERRASLTAGAFMKNRIIRIVPLYWLVTAFVIIITLLMPHVMYSTVLRPWHVLASFFFLPAKHPVVHGFFPLVIPGWSLNYEMLFYVIFALAIAFSAGSRFRRFMIIASLIAATLAIGTILQMRFPVMSFYASPKLLEFLTGVLLGVLSNEANVRCSWYWLASTVAGFAILAAGRVVGVGYAQTIAAATMIVAGAVFLPALRPNPLSFLGDASYSLYLTHVIALAAVGFLWGRLFTSFGSATFVIAGVSATVVLALVVYTCFERPTTRRLKKLSSGKPKDLAALANKSTLSLADGSLGIRDIEPDSIPARTRAE